MTDIDAQLYDEAASSNVGDVRPAGRSVDARASSSGANGVKAEDRLREAAGQLRASREPKGDALRQTEQILRALASHTQRAVCCYDMKTGQGRRWDDGCCAAPAADDACADPLEDLICDAQVLPDSTQALQGIRSDIRRGVPDGEVKLHVQTPDGQRAWLNIKYSTLYDETGAPVSVVISRADVTQQHERELAYARCTQTAEESRGEDITTVETDLTADRVEKQSGGLLPPDLKAAGKSHTQLVELLLNNCFAAEDREEAGALLSREGLLALYADGTRELIRRWHVRFGGREARWVKMNVQLISDPYTGHILAFFRVIDVTQAQEQQLATQRQARQDGLTEVLNRAATEAAIRKALTAAGNRCILAILDLDDLKNINDSFGHPQGDQALKKIASALKSHFRSSDIIGRIGGDEFVIFLPQVNNEATIHSTISMLIRFMSTISLGEQENYPLRCSIGCAAGTAGQESFESLYGKADRALYQVKRNGKNDFAFYQPEMEQDDYRFTGHQRTSLRQEEIFGRTELRMLLNALATFYPLILSVNATRNRCYLMEYSKLQEAQLQEAGSYTDFMVAFLKLVEPEDRLKVLKRCGRQSLVDRDSAGKGNFTVFFRCMQDSRVRTMELSCLMYQNSRGEACCFQLLREPETPEQADNQEETGL